MVIRPTHDPRPVVFDSPHSGLVYPPDFAPAPPEKTIMTTWDAYVEELFGDAPHHGATLLAAYFPRAYIDANRAVNDIDVELLDAPWPEPVSSTDYTKRGMGLIRRFALPGIPMYERKLTVAEVRHRIDRHYLPYRRALQAELDAAWARDGRVFHFDCHSMKSKGNAMNVDRGSARPDLVISDREGRTAPPKLTTWVAEYFSTRGFTVKINDPYKGGDLVRSYGNPAQRRYSLQIEINRARYLEEHSCERSAKFAPLRAELGSFAAAVAALSKETPVDHFD